MRMTVRKKLERLENHLWSIPKSGPRDAVVGAALARISTEHLFLLLAVAESQCPYRKWDQKQIAAGESLRTAMEAECRTAGFRSVAEFEARNPPAPPSHCIRNRAGRRK